MWKKNNNRTYSNETDFPPLIAHTLEPWPKWHVTIFKSLISGGEKISESTIIDDQVLKFSFYHFPSFIYYFFDLLHKFLMLLCLYTCNCYNSQRHFGIISSNKRISSEICYTNIAISSAKSFKQLTGKTAKVAMLSYSTMGSAHSELTEKVVEATKHHHHSKINRIK